ncbi:MAG: hypothetical protein WA144_14100 [Candidatus Methanoperedens sp.]
MIEKYDGRGELEGNSHEGKVNKFRKSEHEMNSENNRDYVWWLI